MISTRRETKRRLNELSRIPLLATCTPRQLARIDRLGTPIEVAAGRTLTREGAIGRECFVTFDGVAAASRAGRPVGIIGAGSIAGEMALLDGATRNATVVADTPMQLLVLTDGEFRALLEIAPTLAEDLARIADERRLALAANVVPRMTSASVSSSCSQLASTVLV
jgi:CRP-like cAMP-binding protein